MKRGRKRTDGPFGGKSEKRDMIDVTFSMGLTG